MTPPPQMRGLILALALTTATTAPALAQTATDSTWQQHSQAADAAYRARDWRTWRDQLGALEHLLIGHARIAFGLARAEARLGRADSALARLDMFATMGLVRDVAADSDLVSLRALPAFQRIAARIAANADPVAHGDTAFVLPDVNQIPEDIAYDAATRTFYLTSVRRRGIVAVDAKRQVRDFLAPGADSTWGTFAIAIDSARRRLWVTTTAVPQALGYLPSDSGRTALLAYDLATGKRLERHEQRRPGLHGWGDMSVAPNGDVFVSDSRVGALWVLRRGADSLVPLVAEGGPLVWPQDAAAAPDGRRLFVADYLRGIAAVDRETGAVSWLDAAPGIALNGIDGLTLDGDDLIVVQNGVAPNRVVRLRLDAAHRRVVAWTPVAAGEPLVVEPTHGVLVGRDFYFIANSGWNHLGDDGAVNRGETLSRGVVFRAPLR